MCFIMRPCKVLIAQLQDEGLNFLDTLWLVLSTRSSLERIRGEEEINNHLMAATAMAETFGIVYQEE